MAFTDTTATSAPPGEPGEAKTKGFYIGFPMGPSIPYQNDVAVEAMYDYFHSINNGKQPWATGLYHIGTPRAKGIRIDDNRNDLCRMALEDAENNPDAEVLVMLDRDMTWPADGIAQLVQTCTEETPVVCGVYFQRSMDSPYPHVYRFLEMGRGRWDEDCRVSAKLGMEVLGKIEGLGIPEAIFSKNTSLRIAQPDGTPMPEELRLLKNAYGGTGMVAIHLSMLRKMKELAKEYPEYRWRADDIWHKVLAAKAIGEIDEETAEFPEAHPNEAPPRLTLVPKSKAAEGLLEDWNAAELKARAHNCYPWFRERGEKGDMAFFNNAQTLGFNCVVDCSVFCGHLGEVLIGLPDFMETHAPNLRLQRDHEREAKITTVCAVIPTLDPEAAGKVLNDAKASAGFPLLGVIVADYDRRGGTRTLNDGISAAMNTGADAILLLDDDISFPQEGWLKELVAALSRPKVGAVGPSIDCRGPQGKPLEQFLASGGNPMEMPFLCGAAMLYRRTALEHIGPLDNALRHYHSDTDHGFLLRKAGWRLVWVPSVKIDHAIGASGFNKALWDSDREVFEAKWEVARGSVASVANDTPLPSSPAPVGAVSPAAPTAELIGAAA